MKDEEVSLGSSPPRIHGSSMGNLSQERTDRSLVGRKGSLSVMLLITDTVLR